jgi:hypothetical protein
MTCKRIIMPDRTTGLTCSEIQETRTDDCPNADQHTPHPSGYVQHSNWAEEMLKTHTQQPCKGCGKWAIWTPNGQDAGASGSSPLGGSLE